MDRQCTLIVTLCFVSTAVVQAQSLAPSNADRKQDPRLADLDRINRQTALLRYQFESLKAESAVLDARAREATARGQSLRSRTREVEAETRWVRSHGQALEEERLAIEAQRRRLDRSSND
jgi:predicted RNase H-like nuclease (RuvC/YqgF family)